MDPLTSGDPETESVDVLAQNVERLGELFPEVMADGAVNFEALRQLLGDAIDDSDERFGLNWHGKRRARQLALTPSTGTLRPCPEDSVDWDTTQNLMIEGDNLEVLKLLQKSYAGKVKVIYIDPPYNTGKDFVYPDNFKDSIGNYLALTGQTDDEGKKLTSNTEASGRFHTDWLNMMYPRLALARNLLRDDGILFVSIDDSELAHLKCMLDDIFGDDNFVGRVTWERKRKGSHLSQEFVQRTESLLVFRRGPARVLLFGEPAGADEDQPLLKRTNSQKRLLVAAGLIETSLPDQTLPAGVYGSGSSSVELLAPATIRSGRFSSPVSMKGPFIWTQENLDLELAEGARLFVRTMNLSLRALKAPHRQGFKALSSFLSREVGTNEDALTELADLLDVEEDSVPFDYPKPVSYIQKLVAAATHWDKSAVVLDFFAGSGTTGDATLRQNAADGGKRRYLLVQLPEALDAEDKEQRVAAAFCESLELAPTIAELTKERLRRAGATLAEREGTEGHCDVGFRVFKLGSSNLRTWDPYPDDLPVSLEQASEHVKPGRSEQDLLYEVLLKLGLDLCVPIEVRQFAGVDVHAVGGGVLMACLAPSISDAESGALADGIADWAKALAPVGDTTCVFRDAAFSTDVAKSNLTTALSQAGIPTVRSI